jgi:hypothetical protein
MKAAYLYGDCVHLYAVLEPLADAFFSNDDESNQVILLARRALGRSVDDYPPTAEHLELTEQYWLRLSLEEIAALKDILSAVGTHVELMPEQDTIAAFRDFISGQWDVATLGVPVVDIQSARYLREIFRWVNATSSDKWKHGTWLEALRDAPDPFMTSTIAGAATREGSLTAELLGELPAFPEADWEVLADVRERLVPARVRFRSAMSYLANELAGVRLDEFASAVAAAHRRIVAPALTDIDEALEDLHAKPTLLRLASDKLVSGAATASLAVCITAFASGAADIGVLGTVAATPSVLTGAAREMAHRRQLRQRVAAQPLWLLRAARP